MSTVCTPFDIAIACLVQTHISDVLLDPQLRNELTFLLIEELESDINGIDEASNNNSFHSLGSFCQTRIQERIESQSKKYLVEKLYNFVNFNIF